MKLFIVIILTSACLLNFKAQSSVVQDISDELSLNYVLSNIDKVDYSFYGLYERSFFVSVYTIFDTKATPKGYFEGHDSVLSSVLVSVMPDGDYYTKSNLYKIEGLLDPKVQGIAETTYPDFELLVEHGKYGNRKTEKYKLHFKE
ncbi:hypothetical protein FKX85_14525 [Echinicola soli]|uniref:Uncharacterized protein n=1 Tax=Echinicola soli TaxID=2591634 RepID=A0A514CK48_9BACT|nr:hypothetical protein [Echinicola soli]QDH80188.1 hypothetical protein FKX85_14525 [Echinicola soli]